MAKTVGIDLGTTNSLFIKVLFFKGGEKNDQEWIELPSGTAALDVKKVNYMAKLCL